MMTAGDHNGSGGSGGSGGRRRLDSLHRVHGRVKKGQKGNQPAAKRTSEVAKIRREALLEALVGHLSQPTETPSTGQETSVLHSSLEPSDETSAADEAPTSLGIPCCAPGGRNNSSYACDNDAAGDRMETDDAWESRNIENNYNIGVGANGTGSGGGTDVLAAIPGGSPQSNVSVKDGEPGNQSTSDPAIKESLIHHLPLGLLGPPEGHNQDLGGKFSVGWAKDPYGDPLFDVNSGYIGEIICSLGLPALGEGEGPSIEGESMDATMSDGTAPDKDYLVPRWGDIPPIAGTLEVDDDTSELGVLHPH
ncbi:hypothetical protein TWF481_011646 [Arthrobotrys musiformis]|uniref:Uncharacterized protein n=1 Tax=Arthrobotrys musiformis TaxID=47236 RepID=A0AAV9W029_9PEZI